MVAAIAPANALSVPMLPHFMSVTKNWVTKAAQVMATEMTVKTKPSARALLKLKPILDFRKPPKVGCSAAP